MKKNTKLTLLEFYELYQSYVRPSYIVFDIYNQAWKSEVSTYKFKYIYERLLCSHNPNKLYMVAGEINQQGYYDKIASFEGVEYIQYLGECGNSATFKVVCSDFYRNKSIEYVIVLDFYEKKLK